MKENKELSQKIIKIIETLRPKPAQISFAVINLKTSEPEISGFNMNEFIYPASVYKIFIGAEILRKVYQKELNLSDIIEIKSPNEVDKDIRLFPKSTKKDQRPLLKAGDKVTIDYLLDLVFSRSDNTASNTLMDIAGREDINNHIILPNGWSGSDVTRKFIDRLKEEKEYRVSKITVSNARHLAEFFYKVEKGELVNNWVSDKLKSYMHNWNRGGREGLYIPVFVDYYRKGGWLEINGYKINLWSAVKNVWKKGYAVNKWTNDAGVVTGKNSHYVVVLLSLTKSPFPWTNFPLKSFSKAVHSLMEEYA
ncbi:MAG: serine hydrolase [Parcubacteria group bacterium]